MIQVHSQFKIILDKIHTYGGISYFVGGCVRDYILGITPKDIDIEVFNLSEPRLFGILKKYARVKKVGQSFGVFKVTVGEHEYDVSLPRREKKTDIGHRGFEITCDPNMSLKDALYRRDFTINSMAMDTLSGNIIDPYNGRLDLYYNTLKATSFHFGEDPLRVLRGFQFASRFNLNVMDLETKYMCMNLLEEYDSISKERIWYEWEKWALKSIKPSTGLRFLEETNWINMYPELSSLIGLPVSNSNRDSVFDNTLRVCDTMLQIINRENITDPKTRTILMFSALCHGFGKAISFFRTDMYNRRYSNDSLPLINSFFSMVGAPNWLLKHVKGLVKYHDMYIDTHIKDEHVRMTAKKLGKMNIQMLSYLIEAVQRNHPDWVRFFTSDAYVKIMEIANKYGITRKAENPIIGGDILKDLGLKPGPSYANIIGKAYELQTQGALDNFNKEEIKAMARSLIKEEMNNVSFV